jgi:hypothetical protein
MLCFPQRAESVSSLKPHNRARNAPRHPTALVWRSARLAVLSVLLAAPACAQKHGEDSSSAANVTHTSSIERSGRRAYDGDPPVIPHPRLGASCTECHTATGKSVPERGFAPANPHMLTTGLSQTANCRQCHVFRSGDDLFQPSEFTGLPQSLHPGDRLCEHAPPVMPHSVFMRENCVACHGGPAARPEIRCSHPERARCTQCHVPHHQSAGEFPQDLVAR